jgi:hypothetical protein
MRSAKRLTGLVVLAGLVAWMAAAPAQANPKPWMISFASSVSFNDNRDGTDADKESEFTLVGTPRFDFRFDNQRTAVGFFLSPSLKWRSNPREAADGDPQNDTEIYAAVGADFSHRFAERAWLKLGDTFDYTDDPDITLGGVGVRRSANHVSNRGSAGFGVGLTRKLWLKFQGDLALKRFDDDVVAADEDEDTFGGQADVSYRIGQLFDVFGMFRVSDFENKSTERDRGALMITGGGGLERAFAERVKGRLTLGGQKAMYDEDAMADADSLYAQATAMLGGESRFRFTADLIYGLYAPYVRPYSLQELISAAGTLEFDIVRNHLTARMRGQYSMSDYPDEVAVGGGAALPGGDDNLAEFGLGLAFRINRFLSLSTDYLFQNWDSDVRESFSRNTANFAFKAEL